MISVGFVKISNVLFYEHNKDVFMEIIGNCFNFKRYSCYFKVNSYRKSGHFDIDLEKSPIETFLAYIKIPVGNASMVNNIEGIIRERERLRIF